jgi:hypothetical protein
LAAQQSLVQSAAKVRFPAFTSKYAGSRNLTAPYHIIVIHGPKRSLAECLKVALQLPAHIDTSFAAYDDAVCTGVVMV